MLQKQKRSLAGFDREVLLHLGTFLAAKGGIGEDDVVSVLFLHIADVFGKGVGVDDVGRLDPVQDHVHNRNHIGERFLFLAVEGFGLQGFQVRRGQITLTHIVIRLAQEASGTDRAIIDRLANPGFGHLDHRADQRAWRVVFAAIAPRVAHVFDFGLVEVAKFMLFLLGAEAQGVHQFKRIPQGITALEFVLNLAKDFTDFVFDGIRACGALFEALQVGEQIAVDVINQVRAASWSNLPLILGAAQRDQRCSGLMM